MLRALFLLFHNSLLRFLPFFGPRNIDRALGRHFNCKGHTSEKENDPARHLKSKQGAAVSNPSSQDGLKIALGRNVVHLPHASHRKRIRYLSIPR